MANREPKLNVKSEKKKEGVLMKPQKTITDRIVENINQALEAIPRALHLEGETQMRKTRTTQRTRTSTRTRASTARKKPGRPALAAKRTKRRSVKLVGGRSQSASAARRTPTRTASAMRATQIPARKRGPKAAKRATRKATRARKQASSVYVAPISQAA